MNLLDMLIVAVVAFLLVRGVSRGFFREIGSLAGVVLGIWLAILYQPVLTKLLEGQVPGWRFLPLISFGLIFVAILLGCNLAAWGLMSVSKKVLLGWLDRSLGFGLALLKGILITYLGIILLTFFAPSKNDLIAESRLAPLIITSYQSIVNSVAPTLYKDFQQRFFGQTGAKPGGGLPAGPGSKHGRS